MLLISSKTTLTWLLYKIIIISKFHSNQFYSILVSWEQTSWCTMILTKMQVVGFVDKYLDYFHARSLVWLWAKLIELRPQIDRTSFFAVGVGGNIVHNRTLGRKIERKSERQVLVKAQTYSANFLWLMRKSGNQLECHKNKLTHEREENRRRMIKNESSL